MHDQSNEQLPPVRERRSGETLHNCERCPQQFWAKPSRHRRWHDKKCHGRTMVTSVERVCPPPCGKTFTARLSIVEAGYGNYHDHGCANRARALDERERFEANAHGPGVEPAHLPGIGPCVEWTGTRNTYGFGVMALADRKQVMAHRLAWTYAHGPLQNGEYVLHRCDNPPCLRLDHLFIGSKGDNNRDRTAKNRQAKGVNNGGGVKLNDDKVREIRERYALEDISQQSLADEYGVSKPIINLTVRRLLWKHVE